MATEAQINANRQNAQHSTGPQTARGKARTALNALKHGLRARIILTHDSTVEGESTGPFAHLLAGLVAEYAPVGFVEAHCVETMAVAAWRLRLVIQSELESSNDPNADLRYEWALKFDQMNREQDAALLARGIKPFAPNPPVIPPERHCLPPAEKLLPLMRYEAHLDRQFHRAFHLLQQLQLARAGEPSPAGDGTPPADEGNSPTADVGDGTSSTGEGTSGMETSPRAGKPSPIVDGISPTGDGTSPVDDRPSASIPASSAQHCQTNPFLSLRQPASHPPASAIGLEVTTSASRPQTAVTEAVRALLFESACVSPTPLLSRRLTNQHENAKQSQFSGERLVSRLQTDRLY